ncbi:hypothetical protein I350_02585 [Cryptococcus amylolentus CBS 6273]|uniref:BZIP domain-containing protein n=1 Tax=Cryptococcus amylolentus CBS 6273 TaxID=1296118 RepID=A0A1E3K9S2_9TREE|nr:hypothetical protein I350_02585 [Cryptococcus amylolentus CBS 6273]
MASSTKRPAPTPTPEHPAKHPRRERDARDDSPPLASIADLDQSIDGSGSAYGDAGTGGGVGVGEDDEARAKAARKEARTMRNRESAQRSRNQRKQHLVWLEQRVVELENENKALKAASPPASPAGARAVSPASSSSSHVKREASPAQSVISLATDLGLPTELVASGSSGVNLSSVAPPPADLDLPPSTHTLPHTLSSAVGVPPSPPPSRAEEGTERTDDIKLLLAQNRDLRERVGLLEGLVKQVVSLSSFSSFSGSGSGSGSGLSDLTPLPQPDVPSSFPGLQHDWSTLLPNMEGTEGMRVSPPLYTSVLPEPVFTPVSPSFPGLSLPPSDPSASSTSSSTSPSSQLQPEPLPSASDSQPKLDPSTTESISISSPSSKPSPSACHSAVVVTPPPSPLSLSLKARKEGGWGGALQRAWGVVVCGKTRLGLADLSSGRAALRVRI